METNEKLSLPMTIVAAQELAHGNDDEPRAPKEKNWRIPLATQLLLVILASILFTAVPIGVLAYFQYRERIITEKGNQQMQVVQGLAAVLGRDMFTKALDTGEIVIEEYADLQRVFNSVAYNSNSVVVLAGRIEGDYFHVFLEGLRPLQPRNANLREKLPMSRIAYTATIATEQGRAAATGVEISDLTGLQVIIAHAPILDANQQVIGVVGASRQVNGLNAYSLAFAMQIVTIAVLVLLVFVWVPVLWVRKRIKKPIEGLTKQVKRMAAGDFSRPITSDSMDEIGKLRDSLAYLQGELKGVVAVSEQISKEIAEGTLFDTNLDKVGKGEFAKVTESLADIKDTLVQYLQDLNCILVILNRDGQVVFMNKNTGRYGYQEDDVLNRSIFEVFPTDTANEFYEAMERARSTREMVALSVTSFTPFGNEYTANYHVIPILDSKYKLGSFLLFGYDISSLIKSENELKRAYEKTEVQLTKLSVSNALAKVASYEISLAPGERLSMTSHVKWSKELQAFLGYYDYNVLGQFNDLIHPDDREAALELFVKSIHDVTNGTVYSFEYRVRHQEGHYLWARDHIRTFRDEHGRPVLVHGAILDITDHRKLVEAEIENREAAQRASEAKSRFLSSVSHEIRTPLNAILGNVEIQLMKTSQLPEVSEAFQNIHTAGHTLLSLINDILDMSKVESSKLEILNLKYEMPSLVVDTCYLNIQGIGSKKIDFVVDIDPNLPMYFFGDEIRLKQVLNNLLSNAFKYTHQGKVVLRLGFEPTENKDEVMLVITVSDTGQGMKPEEVHTIFDSYSRFNLQENYRTEGVGLGMGITYGIVSIMGGTIDIESEPGVGSTFTVKLPQKKFADEVIGQAMADDLRNFRRIKNSSGMALQLQREPMPYGSVLIVDDVETNRYVASGLLGAYKLKIDTAASGREAIERVKQGLNYDVIFMDHMMPDLDGVQTMTILREEHDYQAPIVALTANALVTQAEEFLALGFDDYISKPIDTRHLNLILNRLVRDNYPDDVVQEARAQWREQADEPDLDADITDPKMLRIFLRDIQAAIMDIKALTSDKHLSAASMCHDLRTAAHKIKGILGSMGSKKLAIHADTLEQLAKEGKAPAIAKSLPWFMSELDKLTQELSERLEAEQQAEVEAQVQVQTEPTYRGSTATRPDQYADLMSEEVQELLAMLQTACEDYDIDSIENVLSTLTRQTLGTGASPLADKLHDHLLRSEFDEMLALVNEQLR